MGRRHSVSAGRDPAGTAVPLQHLLVQIGRRLAAARSGRLRPQRLPDVHLTGRPGQVRASQMSTGGAGQGRSAPPRCPPEGQVRAGQGLPDLRLRGIRRAPHNVHLWERSGPQFPDVHLKGGGGHVRAVSPRCPPEGRSGQVSISKESTCREWDRPRRAERQSCQGACRGYRSQLPFSVIKQYCK